MKEFQRRGRDGIVFLFAAGVVIAVGAMALLGRTALDQARQETSSRIVTSKDMLRIQDAMRLFVKRNQRLPCPADGAESLYSDNGSTERWTAGYRKCTFASGHDMSYGTLPWRTLGLQPEDALDRWGRRISYRAYDGDGAGIGSLTYGEDISPTSIKRGMNFLACAKETLVRDPSQSPTSSFNTTMPPTSHCAQAAMTVYTNDLDNLDLSLPATDPSYDATGYGWLYNEFQRQELIVPQVGGHVIIGTDDLTSGTEANDYRPALGTGTAYMLISHGENGRGAWQTSGGQNKMPDSTDESENVNANTDYIDPGFRAIHTLNGTQAFDDIVLTVSVENLAKEAGLWISDTYDPDEWSQAMLDYLESGGGPQYFEDMDFVYFRKSGTAKSDQISFNESTSPEENFIDFGSPTTVGTSNDGIGSEVILRNYQSGCVWLDFPFRWTRQTMRAYWEFRVYGGSDSADGYTFVMVPGTTVTTPDDSPCGNSKEGALFSYSDYVNGLIPPDYDPAPPGYSWPHKPVGTDLGAIGAKPSDPRYSPLYEDKFPQRKMGVEFDFYAYGNIRNDPANNHIAVFRENSNIHGNRLCSVNAPGSPPQSCTNDWTWQEIWGTNPTCSFVSSTPGQRGCDIGNNTTWMEDRDYCNISTDFCCMPGTAGNSCRHDHPSWDACNCCMEDDTACINYFKSLRRPRVTPDISEYPYRVRIDADRYCNSNCTVCGGSGGEYVHFKLWTDCSTAACADIHTPASASFDSIPGVKRLDYCFRDPGMDDGNINLFDTVKVGFTYGTGANISGMQLSGFKVGSE
ncbi:MAG TPA: hypothetical protein DCW68_03715 [Rhodospirillaceae bacterium]|nr:MAG: hypothetical protein A2018_07795 [Alphaproteobacteria bacterium GWF2_58_20]HAU29201.1 hypothetical protein [Rhodospirillaceae bacterium]